MVKSPSNPTGLNLDHLTPGRLINKLKYLDHQHPLLKFYLLTGIIVVIISYSAYAILNPQQVVIADYAPFANQQEYDQFIADNPLITATPPTSATFQKSSKIRDDKSVVYSIKLSSIPIKPSMDDAYRQAYVDYLQTNQQQAIDWIKTLDLDPQKLAIIWSPDLDVARQQFLGESTKPNPQKDSSTTITPTPTPTSATPRFPQ